MTDKQASLCNLIHTRLRLHFHEKPLVADQLFTVAELVQCRKTEANPAEVLCQGLFGELVGVAIDADDETVAGEVIDFAEFQEGHQTAMR